MWLQDTHCAKTDNPFDETNSRSIVTLGTLRGREDCVEMDGEKSIAMFYRNKPCRNGRMEYEEFQEHTPPTWEPKCVIILLATKSRADLRDQLVEQGRILVHPLRISLNYTTTLSEEPDHELASTNCALGREMQKLYEYDTAGQELTDKYLALQAELETARKQFEVFNRIYQGLSVYRPPISPPPPAAPPALVNAPPAAPVQVSLGERNDQLRQRVEDLEVEVDKAAAAVDSCVPSKDHICGRSSIAAPNPWIAANGRPCAGNATREAIEGMYCGYWGSPVCRAPKVSNLQTCILHVTYNLLLYLCLQVNPDAAESEEAAELLSEDGAPYCFSEFGEVLKCAVTADRTNRAGIYELEVCNCFSRTPCTLLLLPLQPDHTSYVFAFVAAFEQEWARIDRPYCESDFFRELNLDNASASVAECRASLLARIDKCKHGVCPQCVSPCNYPVARTVGSVMKCMNMQKHYGFVAYYQTSDAGQLARSLHGARRKDNYKPV